MRIEAIIPTVKGREASLERLLASLPPSVAPRVIEDSKTCGWGWELGMELSTADYLLLACDDQEFLGEQWVDICVETVEEGLLPCPRVWLPNGAIESQGGDMDAFAHIIGRPQKDRTLVDYTTIPFLSAKQAQEIGMLADLHYCTDVWVSYRGRQLGYETVLRHGFDVRHWHEAPHRGAGMSQSDRDAMDEATMRKELSKCESLSPAA